mgnify:CR=1 FL=1
MISRTLRDARKYEEEAEKSITAEERPLFHLSPRTGWMNDPNGFSFYRGKYHLFYQYYPYAAHWDDMHWGHAVSDDLLHWEYLPAALAPDTQYDRDGCFSGSALELPDGRQMLLYTGVVNERQPDGKDKGVQRQCIAIGDGTDYEKYTANPAVDVGTLPEGADKCEFRDPKIWQETDGTYYFVAASADEQRDGQIVLFSSGDAFQWSFEKTLVKNEGRFGTIWECPDFFELDGKWVLLASPMDMLPQGFEYHNGNGTLCLIGSYDRENKVFSQEYDQSIDYGIDFYAAQTLKTPDGRRVMIAWMQNWDTCNLHKSGQKWQGQMTIPRELSIRDGRLYQQPVRELETMRCNKVEYRDLKFSGNIRLEGICGRKVDMEIEVKSAEGEPLFQRFSVRFAKNDQYQTSVSFRPYESVVKLDRKFSGSRRAIIHQRRCRVAGPKDIIKMRLILDEYSVEVFINDGVQVLSGTIFTEPQAQEICFYTDGTASMNVVKYDLEPLK